MKRWGPAVFVLSALGLMALTLRWPGDIPWNNDEPLFFQRVLTSLETGKWWIMALPGSAGITYGPVAWWVYRALWPLTENLETIVLIKAGVSQLTCFGFAYATLALLKLPRRMALLILVSPYFFLYSRVLWDNCFLLPLISILLYLSVRFRQRPSFWLLVFFSCTAWLALHIHLMAVVFIGPAAAALVTAHLAWWKKYRLPISTLVVLSALSYLPYLLEIRSGSGTGTTKFLRLDVFPLTLVFWPRFYSPLGFAEYFYPEWANGIRFSFWISEPFALIPFGLVWYGLWTYWRECRWLAVFSLATLLLLALLHWIFSLQTHPHYAIPASLLALICLAQGYAKLAERRWVRMALVFWLVGQGVALEGFARLVHERGGDRRSRYGAVLANQIEVAKTLGKNGAITSQEVENYSRSPHALSVLRELVALESKAGTRWLVKYADSDGDTGWIAALESGVSP